MDQQLPLETTYSMKIVLSEDSSSTAAQSRRPRNPCAVSLCSACRKSAIISFWPIPSKGSGVLHHLNDATSHWRLTRSVATINEVMEIQELNKYMFKRTVSITWCAFCLFVDITSRDRKKPHVAAGVIWRLCGGDSGEAQLCLPQWWLLIVSGCRKLQISIWISSCVYM